MLVYIGRNKVLTRATVNIMRVIKVCALVLLGAVAIGEGLLILGNTEDHAGGVFMGMLIAFGSSVAATVAMMFERISRNALDAESGTAFTD